MHSTRTSIRTSALRPGAPAPLKPTLCALAIGVWLTACGIKGDLLLEEENTPQSKLSSEQTTDVSHADDVIEADKRKSTDVRPNDQTKPSQPEAGTAPQSTPGQQPPPEPTP